MEQVNCNFVVFELLNYKKLKHIFDMPCPQEGVKFSFMSITKIFIHEYNQNSIATFCLAWGKCSQFSSSL